VPKLFLKVEPGAILANDTLVNLVRGWPALTEKTFAIGLLVLGYFASRWWSDALIAVAVLVTIGALLKYIEDRKNHAALVKLWVELDD
jgi:hypothetical protein